MEEKVRVGDVVYYARILLGTETFDVMELKVRGLYDTYFATIEKRSKCSFIFPYSYIGSYIFFNRKECLDKVKDSEEEYKKTKKE